MTGRLVSDLQDMLAGMDPLLSAEPYCFVLSSDQSLAQNAFATIREDEGATCVLLQTLARDVDAVSGSFARITLQVHSDLEGVGLTAAIATTLSELGIACNVIAGLRHDHLFVPWGRRDAAIAALEKLAEDARR
ncbi:MAG: ACT domain-containing protein [Erythrobacter sp.]